MEEHIQLHPEDKKFLYSAFNNAEHNTQINIMRLLGTLVAATEKQKKSLKTRIYDRVAGPYEQQKECTLL